MAAHYQAVVRSKTGKIVPGANVSVFDQGTTTLADLFSDEAATVSIDNPLQADDDGKVDFYVVAGEYDILIQRFDIEDTRFDDVSILELAPSAFSPKYISANLSANQTSNLAAGDHVEFDTTIEDSGHITLATGTGQANGIFTVPAGVWNILVSPVRINFSGATGFAALRIKDGAGNSLGAGSAQMRPPSSSNNDGVSGETSALFVNSAEETIEVEIQGPTAVNNINSSTGISIVGLS